jgi:hypothetical protein
MMCLLADLVPYGRAVVNPRPFAGTVHAEGAVTGIAPVFGTHRYYAYFQPEVAVWKAEFRQSLRSIPSLGPHSFVIQTAEELPYTPPQLIAWHGRTELPIVLYIQKVIRAADTIQRII